jgi:hypothetical protein
LLGHRWQSSSGPPVIGGLVGRLAGAGLGAIAGYEDRYVVTGN